MKFSELAIEEAGYHSLITVHDELLAEKYKGILEEFERIIGRNPGWAKGLPIKVKGWTGPRYRK
jgi:hypothetical protein